MTPPRLFVEACAGVVAVSLVLQGGKRAKPPFARPGAKTGYAGKILAAMGLRRGLGAERYLWCEPDEEIREILAAFADPVLAVDAAGYLRKWAPPARDEEAEARLWSDLAAQREDGSLWSPSTPRARRVAALVWLWGRSFANKGPEAGYMPARSKKGVEVWNAHPPEYFADALLGAPTFPDVEILDDAAGLADVDLDGAIVYFDPPYVGTTGYRHSLARVDVVAYASDAARRGAVVVGISEAERVEIPGWVDVEPTAARQGSRRAYSKQQREILTLSRSSRWRQPEQASLF